jgi:hypothetical protein
VCCRKARLTCQGVRTEAVRSDAVYELAARRSRMYEAEARQNVHGVAPKVCRRRTPIRRSGPGFEVLEG